MFGAQDSKLTIWVFELWDGSICSVLGKIHSSHSTSQHPGKISQPVIIIIIVTWQNVGRGTHDKHILKG